MLRFSCRLTRVVPDKIQESRKTVVCACVRNYLHTNTVQLCSAGKLRGVFVCAQLKVSQVARGERDSRLTDISSELDRQRKDCDTQRDKLRQRQVTLAAFYTDRNWL